jgi:hypothetical protein
MSRSNRYSPELRERAMKMVKDNRADYPSEWAAFTAISKLFAYVPGNTQDLGSKDPS